MARPKLGDSESKRLQMVITEDELKAIEDWQFAHRVPSKSEAIRRLVQVGLRTDREVPTRIGDVINVTGDLAGVTERAKRAFLKMGPDTEQTEVARLLVATVKNVSKALERQMKAMDNAFSFFSEIGPFIGNTKTIADAIEAADTVRAKLLAGDTSFNRLFKRREKDDDAR